MCGICVEVCPAGAKQVRNDLTIARSLVKHNSKVIASVAPAFVAEFPGLTESRLVKALRVLGFDQVSETALGAQMVSHQTAKYIKKNGIHISSACPSVVELVKKYYPEHEDKIAPIMSPLMAHSKLLKQHFGDDCKVVFIGPCIAKKHEADEMSDLIDVSITFKDLKKWWEEEGVELDLIPENDDYFVPYRSHEGALYPIDGGMIEGIRKDAGVTDASFMTFSGQENVKDVMEELSSWPKDEPLFLELLACRGGCVNGPGMENKGAIGFKRHRVIRECSFPKRTDKAQIQGDLSIDLSLSFLRNSKADSKITIEESAISDALESIGKLTEKDHLNCSGCGYDTCRSFAKAMLEGKAERSMCVSFMRKVAHDKASVLLQKIPAAVVVVDDQMKVIESNRRFASLLGEDIEMIFDVQPRLEGSDFRKLLPDYKIFETLLRTGEESMERKVRMNEKLYNISVFSIQKYKIVCGIIQNLHDPEVRRDFVRQQTEDVIKQNMETVQKIAFLLGENASHTNSILNSITESFDAEGVKDEG
jgi:ferredoxin